LKAVNAQRRHRWPLLVAALLVAAWPALPARADVVVVVNINSSITSLSHDEAVNIFMGRYRRAPDGSNIHPLDLEADSPIRSAFYRRLIDKSREEVNAYWVRLVFAGRTLPPAQTTGQDEMLKKLASDQQAVGYLDSAFLERQGRSNLVRNLRALLPLLE
jgi:ABC-type phosphate transport system substrate-binding protein